MLCGDDRSDFLMWPQPTGWSRRIEISFLSTKDWRSSLWYLSQRHSLGTHWWVVFEESHTVVRCIFSGVSDSGSCPFSPPPSWTDFALGADPSCGGHHEGHLYEKWFGSIHLFWRPMSVPVLSLIHCCILVWTVSQLGVNEGEGSLTH